MVSSTSCIISLSFFMSGLALAQSTNSVEQSSKLCGINNVYLRQEKADEMDEKIKKILKAAEQEITAERYTESIKLLMDGIRMLGDLYLSPNLIDDTASKMVLADIAEHKQQPDMAAKIMKRVLEDRLSLFEKKCGELKGGASN